MQRKAIIFGSSGFIGSALVEQFIKSGFRVFGCDIKNTSSVLISDFFNHELLETDSEKIFVNKFDVCINCAGSASVPYSFSDPFKDYELNTRIVFKILSELQKVNSTARFINLSSAAVYGNPSSLPIRETDQLRPISPYGNHKLMSEMIVNQFREYFGIMGSSLRIFSAYGPGLRKQIFWDIYQKAQAQPKVIMHGTGNESRDFIFIDDLVKAIYLIATTTKELKPVYNIANGQEITIKRIVELFCSEYGEQKAYEFNGITRAGDPNNWLADISSLKELGYVPDHSIESGIYQTVKWLKQQK